MAFQERKNALHAFAISTDSPADFEVYDRFLSPDTLSAQLPEHLRAAIYELYALCHMICLALHRRQFLKAADYVDEMQQIGIMLLGNEEAETGLLYHFDVNENGIIDDDVRVAYFTALDAISEGREDAQGRLLEGYSSYCGEAHYWRSMANHKLYQLRGSVAPKF